MVAVPAGFVELTGVGVGTLGFTVVIPFIVVVAGVVTRTGDATAGLFALVVAPVPKVVVVAVVPFVVVVTPFIVDVDTAPLPVVEVVPVVLVRVTSILPNAFGFVLVDGLGTKPPLNALFVPVSAPGVLEFTPPNAFGFVLVDGLEI